MTTFVWSKNAVRLVALLVSVALSACQITPTTPAEPASYNNYYLRLKSLNKTELLNEIALQKDNINANYQAANLNLVLLYALPSSPIYNPYTAKTLLNNFAPTLEQATHLSSTDFAFITLLKDQLNQQIYTSNKLIVVKQQLQENKDHYLQSSNNYQVTIDKLTQQIALLKKIELNIAN